MTERELRDLGAYVELPPERDLAHAVRERIGTRRPRPGKLVVVPALVVLAVALAFAVPPARSEILRWLGLGNARIEFVDRLPHVEPQRPLDLGERLSLDDARERVAYHVVTSNLLGAPREVHLLGDQIAFVYGDRKLVVTQSHGVFFTKEVGPGTHVQELVLNGYPAYWVSGEPHFLGYVGRNGNPRPVELYLAGNALIWQRGELTLRLEGKLTRAEAVKIARSFR
jgi:hypothetical protein